MSGKTKAERLTELKRLYIQRAWSDAELAEKLDTRRETIFRDRRELEDEGYPFLKDEYGRWKIDRTRLLSEIKISLHEALTLYLAARKTARQTPFHHPHAANAVEKLAAVLRQPMAERLLKTADRLLAQKKDPDKIKILETITQAWVEQRKARIEYQRLGHEGLTRHTISPYLIEPSIWSDSVYVIAQSDFNDKIFAFKIERILHASLSGETFEMLDSFNDEELLKHAWGIWYADKPPVTVKLRFAPNPGVIQRLEESVWHPLERIEPTEGGGRLWSVEIAEWREMLPWIRGWGADVEALEPKELRDEIIRNARNLALQYKIMTSEPQPFMYLWAKAEKKDPSKLHRLPYHLLDVGQTALGMWDKAIDAESKRQLCEWLKCDEETAGRTLAFLVSLHDLGKASPDFQIKVESAAKEVAKAGFAFPKIKSPNPLAHGVVSAIALKELLCSELGLSKSDARVLAQAAGGHHGAWIRPVDWTNASTDSECGAEWAAARKELLQAMKDIFKPQTGFELPQEDNARNTFLTLFSGFVSVADWIGSMTEYFPYETSVSTPLEEYALVAASRAEKALTALGWFNWQADGNALTFKEMFPLIDAPNSVQQKIMDEVSKTALPALLILEAPTGSGKTEAALYAADVWMQAQRGNGMYVAMPTQATSNQMYDRVKDFLRKRYADDLVNLHLVHGGALLKDMPQAENIYDEDKPDPQGEVRAESWFLPRKRTLLAPFGVGTVDQALMSVLQTRHFFVRMFGLQSKVVVFDEVHAYDTYMSQLFKRLLQWLRQIGVSVILLSATLPEKTRRDFAAAYLGMEEIALSPADYPRLTIASGAEAKSLALETPSSRKIQLQACHTEPQTIIAHLQTALQDGGCAAVICNRVKRAQEIYKEILAAGLVPEEDLILFHARFPFAWREEIEKSVLDKFGKNKNGGKNPNRPKKSILVATQVIEQSLDLDFDLMVTDLAPMDFLIQRAGRLHRHSQNDPARPQNLKTPTLLISFPQAEDVPEFGDDEYVYERSVMLKTWLALKEKSTMSLPAETTALIEAVYGEAVEIADEALRKELEEAIKKAAQNERREIFNAAQRLIDEPEKEDLLSQRNDQLDEDDPTVHHAFRAMTRSADPGVSLICLHRVNGITCLDPEGKTPIDLSAKPDKELTKGLLRQNVNVQNRVVVNYFSKDEHKPKTVWKETAALKYSIPVVFENGRFSLDGGKYALMLDRKLGLTLEKEEQ